MSKSMTPKINYTKKTISCSGCFFWPRNVPFKIIGTYEYWLNLKAHFLNNPSDITFDLIADNLSRVKQSHLQELKTYAYDDKNSFAWDLYRQFISLVNYCNPLNTVKRRQTNPHGLSNVEFKMLVVEARWLYALFQYWCTRPIINCPKELLEFCMRHDISLNRGHKPKTLVIEALSAIYGNDDLLDDEDSFYRNHLLEDLPRIQYFMDNTLQGTPSTEPLRTLLQK